MDRLGQASRHEVQRHLSVNPPPGSQTDAQGRSRTNVHMAGELTCAPQTCHHFGRDSRASFSCLGSAGSAGLRLACSTALSSSFKQPAIQSFLRASCRQDAHQGCPPYLAYLQGPFPTVLALFHFSLVLNGVEPAPECHKSRHGVRIEFEITCCQGACHVILCTALLVCPGLAYQGTWRLVQNTLVSSTGETASNPPLHQCSQSSVILGLCDPSLGPHHAHPIIHTSPRFGWPAGRAVNWVHRCGRLQVHHRQPTCLVGEQLLGHCSSHLHPTSRRQIQSWPQISKLGCLIPAGQLEACDSASSDQEKSLLYTAYCAPQSPCKEVHMERDFWAVSEDLLIFVCKITREIPGYITTITKILSYYIINSSRPLVEDLQCESLKNDTIVP